MAKKHVSAYKNAALNPNRPTKKKTSKKRVSAYDDDEKNQGGLLGGVGYLLGSTALGLGSVVEGATDIVTAAGDLLRGDTDMAKYRFMDNQMADAQEKLRESYNPGTVMGYAGDVASGIGTSLTFMIPYVGPYLAAAGFVGQGISKGAEKTGDVGLKEIGYGLATGGMEFGLEALTAGLGSAAKNIGASVARKIGRETAESAAKTVGREALESTAKAAGKQAGKLAGTVNSNAMWKSVLKETGKGFAGEFIEEAAAEAFDPFLQRSFKIDENARADWGQIAYAGLIGGISGGLMSAGPAAINYKSAVKTGRMIRESGETEDVLKHAETVLAGANRAKTRLESKPKQKTELGTDAGIWQKTTAKAKDFSANRQNSKAKKSVESLSGTVSKNLNAYRSYYENPNKSEKELEASDALLGEMFGNVFALENATLLDVYEEAILEASEEDKEALVREFNERARAAGAKKHDYTVKDMEDNSDDILTAIAARRMQIDEYGLDFVDNPSPGKASQADAEAAQAQGSTEAANAPTTPQMPVTEPTTATEAAGAVQTAESMTRMQAPQMAATETAQGTEGLGAVRQPTDRQTATAKEDEGITRLKAKASEMGLGKIETDMMASAYSWGSDLSPEDYAIAYAEGVYYGKQNRRLGDIPKDAAFSRLSTTEKENAMQAGRLAVQADTERREALAAKKNAPAREAGKKSYVTLDLKNGKRMRDMTDRDYATYKAAEILGEAMGTEIVITDTLGDNEAGKINGFYDRKTGRIHVALDAGRDAKGTALYTLAHEATHAVREWSPTEYQKLSDFVGARMGESMTELIERKKTTLRKMAEYRTATEADLTDAAQEEVVADAMETILSDGTVLEDLATYDKTLWEKIKDWIESAIRKIKEAFEGVSPNSQAAKVLADSMDSLTELQEMFATAARKTGERTKAAEKGTTDPVTRMNEENMHVSGEKKLSFEPADFEKPITLQDVDRLREIVNSRGDISINQFTSKEIEEAQKWAYKFYRELGTKSPFFRAWFGDWRAYDQNRINIVSVPTIEISEVSLANGNYWIEDTKWDVYAGKTLNDDTRHHSGGQRINVKALTAIDAILENAVLLDTIVSKPDTKKKSDNTAFLHKLYTIIKYEGKAYIAKSTVEEFYNETTNGVSRRAYNLKAIKIEPAGGQLGNESSSSRPDTSSMEANTSVGIGESHTPIIEDTASDISIADLFAFVKKYDKDFSPKPVNELMLDENKEPRVFYHGTRKQFTEFILQDKATFGRALGDGFYFTPSYSKAHQFANGLFSKGQDRGGIIMPVYLRMENPYVIDESADRTKWRNEYHKGDYDGIIDLKNQTWYVEESGQIKSATDNIGTFDRENPDIRYSIEDSDTESPDVSESETDTEAEAEEIFDEAEITDRDLLLAMAEQLVGDEADYKILSEYKAKHDEQKARQKRMDELADEMNETRDIMFTGAEAEARSNAAKRLGEISKEMSALSEEIGKVDRELVNIEGMKVIRNLIARERNAVRDTYKNKYKAMYERGKESRETTEARRSARRLYNRLHRLLFAPTKSKNVPYQMQSVVAEALKAADMQGAELERLAQLEEQLARLEREAVPDPEAIEKKLKEIERQENKVGKTKEVTELMIEIYKKTQTIETGDAALVFDNETLQLLEKLRADIGNASIRNMNKAQLTALKDFYTALYTKITTANKTMSTEKAVRIDKLGTDSSTEVIESQALKFLSPRPMESKSMASIRKFFWKNLKPLTVFDAIGSKTLSELFGNVLKGEDVWARDVMEAYDAIDKAKKAHGYNKWDLDEKQAVKTATGETVMLSLRQRMSLLAYMARAQAERHLSDGGFTFAPDATTIERFKEGKIKYEAVLNDQKQYKMRKEDLYKMGESLTKEQRAYVEEVQAYLSSLGEKGNTVSRKLYGIDLFKENYYFPIKSNKDYLAQSTGKSGDPNIKNRGTFKETVPDAGNPIVLEDFDKVVVDHVNTMAMYHAFVLPVEDLAKVWNYTPVNVKRDENGNAVLDKDGNPIADTDSQKTYNSLKAEIAKKYGHTANDYILQLLRDLNGGARRDAAASILDKGISAFKGAATMASLSTAIQQPTSIFRALSMIDFQYFKDVSLPKVETMQKYAPVAFIKEMGGHDTSTGARTSEYMNAKEYDSILQKIKAAATPKAYGGDPQARAELFGWLPAKMDEGTWRYLFGACVNEQAAKLGKSRDSEEVLKAAGERFSDIVRRTQVYDSTLTKSEYMRSKDGLMKIATAFGAEPSVVVSMMTEALIKLERGDKKAFRNTTGAVAVSILATAIASSLIYAMRDDDEDETYVEKYAQSLTSELIEGVNPLEYLPVARDVVSLFKGYEIERTDMTLVSNLFEQLELITSSKRSVPDKIFGVSGAVSAFFGVPLTNVYRDAKGLVKTAVGFASGESTTGAGVKHAVGDSVRAQFGLLSKLIGAESGNAYELYKAAIANDGEHFARVYARYKDTKSAELALRQAIRDNDRRIAKAAEAKISGELEAFESIVEQIVAEGHFDRNIIIRAVNNEVSAIRNDMERATAVPRDEAAAAEVEDEERESLYSAADLNDALQRGDTEDYEIVYYTLLADKKERGQTEAQAKASVKSSVTAFWKKRYLAAWEENDTAEMKRIQAVLLSTGLYGKRNDVAVSCEGWVKAYAKKK